MARVSICSAKFVENLDGMRFRINKYNNSGKNLPYNMNHLLIFDHIVYNYNKIESNPKSE